MVRALDCGSRGPPFEPGRWYHRISYGCEGVGAEPAPSSFGPGRSAGACEAVGPSSEISRASPAATRQRAGGSAMASGGDHRLRDRRARELLDFTRCPAGLLRDFRFLLGDELTRRLVAVEPAEDFHRDTPVRGACAVLKDNVEENEAALLRQRFGAFRHAR
ncbi:Hypothetical protein MexAM1_META1p2978 [Methylorubrum extorquens AM1]|uniref:Uncharacterized protein n=1 Tax=Methylorubrum extorquens (strain ATCC 14718 / DSM 1338 / JCM 2805 / NCIMB 9133 / AM1) TaxID=272630 RepID=C5AUW6_METEA|nr:Hypothetical protein MexAM1_META1p2978 [Methylorubrum extorquens AM1]